MTGTPEGVKYLLMVKDQGPHGRALGIPQEPPRELPPGPENLGALMTPTTRVVVWMFRRPNRVWALPITVVLVPAYLGRVLDCGCGLGPGLDFGRDSDGIGGRDRAGLAGA